MSSESSEIKLKISNSEWSGKIHQWQIAKMIAHPSWFGVDGNGLEKGHWELHTVLNICWIAFVTFLEKTLQLIIL